MVMGCLVERYKEELEKQIPEVDLFIPINEYDNFWNKIQELTLAPAKRERESILVF